ncbi:MAG: hypothetical protein J6N76_06345 [Lachnospiraceae bacterium]|nr:hypothetical protein [Lachnospiraceae bacterium]
MKEHLHLNEQKNQEKILVEYGAVQEEFQKNMEKDLEEQRQRFEAAKMAKAAKKKNVFDPKKDLSKYKEQLDQARERVGKAMPKEFSKRLDGENPDPDLDVIEEEEEFLEGNAVVERNYEPFADQIIEEEDIALEQEYEPDEKVIKMNKFRDELTEDKETAQKVTLKNRTRSRDDFDQNPVKQYEYKKEEGGFADKLIHGRFARMAGNASKKLKSTFSSLMKDEKKNIERNKIPNVERLRNEHEAITRTRIIKHTLKPDEAIIEKVVEDKEEKTARKEACRKLITRNVNDVNDLMIKKRASVGIDAKKRMDYRSFQTLSNFGGYLSDNELSDMTELFGQGTRVKRRMDAVNEEIESLQKVIDQKKAEAAKKQQAADVHVEEERIAELNGKLLDISSEKEKADKEGTFPAMDMMTDVIMKIDITSFDLSNDEAIARNAADLEKMACAVKSYTSLLTQNPDYLKNMLYKTTDEKKFGAKNYGGEIMKQLDRLTAVSNYYRLRKLVIEDDLYASLTNEEISMEEEQNDSVKMKNLKKKLRMSYYAGARMEEMFGNIKIASADPYTKDEKASLIRGREMKVKFSVSESDGERADTLRLLYNDEKDAKIKRDNEKAYLNEKVIGGKSVMDETFEFLNEFSQQNQAIDRMEQERFMFAPEKQYHMTTLDPKKQRTTPAAGKYIGYIANVGGASDMPFVYKAVEKRGKKELRQKYKDLAKKTGEQNWGEAPTFVGGKSDYLKDISISDNWNRTDLAFSTEWAYGRTDDEMIEMFDLLSVQKDKNWNQIKQDPEKLAYYESAFKEMTMKCYAIAYATAVRTAESVGVDMLLLHPVDLMQQMTLEHRTITMGNVVPGNMLEENNMPRIQKLFEENNKDGHVLFDLEDFKETFDINGNVNFKYTSFAAIMRNIMYPPDEDTIDRIIKDEDFYTKYVKPEWEAFKAENANHPEKIREVIKFGVGESKGVAVWYVNRHPELFDTKHLTQIYDFKPEINKAIGQMIDKNEASIAKLIAKKRLVMPTKEQLEAYEKSLKDRNMPPTRSVEFIEESIADIEENLRIMTRSTKKNWNELKALMEKKDISEDEQKKTEKLKKEIKHEEEVIIDLKDQIRTLEKVKRKWTRIPTDLN